jgi:hypothetical protein
VSGPMPRRSVASRCLALSGLFEAELLLELMLRHWGHPFATDSHFRTQLLEAAVESLKTSVAGKVLIEGIPPDQMNLVLAIWYAEWNSVNSGENEQVNERVQWLETVKRAVPSCFCDHDSLS